MPMLPEEILAAIDERLLRDWPARLRKEMAAPLLVLGIKHLAGPNYGSVVLCTVEDIDTAYLSTLLQMVAISLRQQL